jgi:hypothetical protein
MSIVNKYIYDKETGLFTNKKGKKIGHINKKGYICITYNKKELRAHRVAWEYVYGREPDGEIDHIDGDRKNNRISNLREVSRLENMNNLECHRNGSFSGVRKRWNKYAVYITINRKCIYIGLYNTKEEAKKGRERYMLENNIECKNAIRNNNILA